MRVTVNTINGKLLVKAPFHLKDELKALPASRWDKPNKAWAYPATVGAARNLKGLADRHRAEGLVATGDAGLQALLRMVKAQDEAQAIKQHVCSEACPKWHHQQVAVQFGLRQQAVIMNMATGTGKTKVTIDLITQRGHRRVLVLTKKKAIGVWPRQFGLYSQKQVHVVRLDAGSVARRVNQAGNALDYATEQNLPCVLVLNYESAWRDGMAEFLLAANLDLMVLDEGHKIKSPGGKASKFCQQLRLRVPCVIETTATFMGDKPIDIYGQMRAIDPAVFGTSFARFKDEFVIMGGYLDKEILGYKNQDEMMRRLAPYLYQVDKSVLGLLPTRNKTYYCQLSEAARKLYDEFDREAYVALKIEADKGTTAVTMSADNVLTKLLRCQQMTGGVFTDADGVRHFVDDSKLELLKSVIEDLRDGDELQADSPVVIYAKFTDDILRIRAIGESLGYRTGEISGRCDDQEKFKDGTVNFLACQIQAGGTGVDGLQDVAHVAIYFSTGYSLTDFEQSLGRLERGGQVKSVLNIFLAAENTIDEDVVQALANKQNVIDALMQKAKQLALAA